MYSIYLTKDCITFSKRLYESYLELKKNLQPQTSVIVTVHCSLNCNVNEIRKQICEWNFIFVNREYVEVSNITYLLNRELSALIRFKTIVY